MNPRFVPPPTAGTKRLEHSHDDCSVVAIKPPIHNPDGVVLFVAAIVFDNADGGQFLERHAADFAVKVGGSGTACGAEYFPGR
jgi:hypothetical protein